MQKKEDSPIYGTNVWDLDASLRNTSKAEKYMKSLKMLTQET